MSRTAVGGQGGRAGGGRTETRGEAVRRGGAGGGAGQRVRE